MIRPMPELPDAFDSVYVRGLAAELHERLAGERTRALLMDRPGKCLYLFLRAGTLEFRLPGMDAEIRWMGPCEPFAGSRPLPANVQTVTAPPDERRLTIELRRLRGTPKAHRLELEWLPRRHNAIWVAGGVIESVQRPNDRLVRGQAYAPPSPTGRPWAKGDMTEPEWQRIVEGLEPPTAERDLVRRVAWASKVNASSLLGRESGAEWGFALWQRLASAAAEEPVRLGGAEGAPYPVPLGAYSCVAADTLLHRVDQRALPSPPSEALRALARELKKAQKSLRSLERELDRTVDPDHLRSIADLLLARLHDVPSGQRLVEIEGFDGTPVEVELDPKTSPRENADAFYRRARKAERAREEIPHLIAGAEARVESLSKQIKRWKDGRWSEEELALHTRTESRGERGNEQQSTRDPYRAFTSSGGIPILVGRGARFNDLLTFKVARPKEVWLHARGGGGAHVVLRWDADDPPPARDLEEAAILAALHSSAKHSNLVPVDWTRRKYVRKPRKSPPGAVAVERTKTLFVTPDRRVLERLSEAD